MTLTTVKPMEGYTQPRSGTLRPGRSAISRGHFNGSPTPSPSAHRRGMFLDAPHTLRPHQTAALRNLTAVLSSENRTQLIAACGSGKTDILAALPDALNAHLIAVFVPNLNLIRQTAEDWRRQYANQFNAVIVCSDPSSGKARRAELDSLDATDVSDAEFAADGFRVLHTPEMVHEFLVSAPAAELPSVVFSTYQSAHIVADGQSGDVSAFDLIVADEAHYLAKVIHDGLKTEGGQAVMHDGRIRARKRVFATATPKVITLNGEFTSVSSKNVVSMADESLFGTVGHEFSFNAAIKAEVIADYELAVLEVNAEQVASASRLLGSVDELNERSENDEDFREIVSAIAVQKLRQGVDGRAGASRIITYHNSVARAHRFVEILNALEPGVARVITGESPTQERLEILRELESEVSPVGVIANVQCLSEGVDIKSLDAVVFVDPRNSVTQIAQGVGRALRKKPDGRRGIIGIPVFGVPTTFDEVDLEVEGDFISPAQVDRRRGYSTLFSTMAIMNIQDARLSAVIHRSHAPHSDSGEPDVSGSDMPSIVHISTAAPRTDDDSDSGDSDSGVRDGDNSTVTHPVQVANISSLDPFWEPIQVRMTRFLGDTEPVEDLFARVFAQLTEQTTAHK